MKHTQRFLSLILGGALCLGMVLPISAVDTTVVKTANTLIAAAPAQLVEKTVSEITFDDMTDINSAMVRGDTEKSVWIADDSKGTNRRDPLDRVIAGIPSLESEGGNKYMRVSDRIANYAQLHIPVASSTMTEKYGEGKYILTFDMKAVTTPTMYFNYMFVNDGRTSDRMYYCEAPFAADKIAFRFRLSLNGKDEGYINGTAPGTLCSLGALGQTDTELNSASHPINELDTWQSFYYEFEITENEKVGAVSLGIVGGNWPIRNADYAIDNIKLVYLDKEGDNDMNNKTNNETVTGVRTDVASEGYEVQGLMLNLDDSRFSEPNKHNAAFLTEKDAITYIDQYIGSHISDVMLTVNTTFMSMYPSDVWDDQLDEYAKTGSAQTAVWARYESLGIDPWALWIDRLWENDVNPWLSFRMNDHHAHLSDGILTGDWFWENYTEYARIKHRSDTIYRGDRCVDFTVKEVRDYWLAYIEEAVNKYDVYGIELDWMRDPIFTTLGNEMAAMDTITEFHRDIKKIVDAAEVKWGHEIKIAIRCARDIETNVDMGFDIITMCAEGIIDMVIPSAYYITDTEIPVLTWKKILQSYKVELVPNVTQGILSVAEGNRATSDIAYYTHVINSVSDNIEVMAGTAASYFAQGADKLYVFNVFGDSADPITEEQKIETSKVTPLSDNHVRWRMQTTIGSYDKVQSMTRRYLLTFQDYAGYFGTSDTQLPAVVGKVEKYAYLHFYTGNVSDNDTVTLYLGMENGSVDYTNAVKVFVNGVRATCLGRVDDTLGLYTKTQNSKLYAFKVDASAIDNSVMVEMTTTDKDKPYNVIYAELVVGGTTPKTASTVNGAASKFTDVPASASYYDAVSFVVENGLFSGTSDTTFEPDTAMNRAMFVTVLGRLAGVDTAKYTDVSFSDVAAGSWYAAYVDWASKNSIVSGIGDGRYGTNDSITAAQVCLMLARYADYKSASTATGITAASYSDASDVPDWAADGIVWALSNGIYAGQNGKLDPNANASRALVATMFYNYVNVFGK